MLFKKKRIYLDRAAGANANPSSPHEEGRCSKSILENARTRIARLIEVQSDDVIFTSGATEANALAILGVARAYEGSMRSQRMKDLRSPEYQDSECMDFVSPSFVPHVLYLPSAHASVVKNMEMLVEKGVEIEKLPIKNWRVDVGALKEILRPETILVSMDAVCGEMGTIWNTREVAEVLRMYVGLRKSRALLHVDASQAPLTEKITRAHFGADLLTLDSSKIGKTRGIGALIAHRTISLTTLYQGGGQERGIRPGSEPFKLAYNFAEDLERAARGRETFRARAESDRIHLVSFIERNIPNVLINEARSRTPHILNISLPGRDADYLVSLLDEKGFAVSTRSACETNSEEGSRAVFTLTEDSERARTTLRISWGPEISSRNLKNFGAALAAAVSFLDQHN